MDGKKFTTLAGFTGIAGGILSMLAVLLSISLCGVGCGEGLQADNEWGIGKSFSWKSNSLSDLGASRVADIFNYPLILAGMLSLIFTAGLLRVYARCTLFHFGGFLALLGGVSLSLLAIFTKADGYIHSVMSTGHFAFLPLAMIFLGLAFVRRGMETKGYTSILAGGLALLVITTAYHMGWHALLGLGLMVPETIEASMISAWIIWMGVDLMRIPAKDATDGGITS